jgi:ABC-type branched-subunit amino acid transport system ATPase component
MAATPMLTRLRIRNFKFFQDVDIELGDVVVFIGPNNAGKTTALQALSLWDLGIRRWIEKKGAKSTSQDSGEKVPAKGRSGVAINRRDLLSLPVPETNLLWRDTHVRAAAGKGAERRTENIRIEIEVEGVTEGSAWTAGLEFDYANAESIYCRPLGVAASNKASPAKVIARQAMAMRVAFLPPMSGLAAREDRLEPGSIQVRLGEGRTAEVLRNLCHQLDEDAWEELARQMSKLFGVTIKRPDYVAERGELTMVYEDRRGITLDLSAAGRGLQQTILLLAHILGNRNTVLLLDEPDAHLEILRQRQIYSVISELARDRGCQVIIASHSEVILNEAADRDMLVAFVGKPHRLDDRSSQAAKSLKSIGFEHYYLAEAKGWVLYLEGSTDLAILKAFARILGHSAASVLEQAFIHYVENQPPKAKEHFYGVSEARPGLVGILITDRLEKPIEGDSRLVITQWKRREIENYLAFPQVLLAYARALAKDTAPGPLFESNAAQRFAEVMQGCISDRLPPAALKNVADRYWISTKVTDDFLDPLFDEFFGKLKLPNLMRKTDYHQLARFLEREDLDPEVAGKLDAIMEVANRAVPAEVIEGSESPAERSLL